MGKSRAYLKGAAKNIQIADHMMYVTLPIVNERRLLLKIFDEIYKAIINCMYSLLYYEFSLGRVKLSDVLSENIALFLKLSQRNLLSREQLKLIQEIIVVHERHSESALEFVRREKVVIMSDSLGVKSLDVRKTKEYLLVAKELLMQLTKKEYS